MVALAVKNLPANAGDISDVGKRGGKRHSFNPWVGKIPWRRKGKSIPVFLPGKLHDRGAWQASSMGPQSQTRLSSHTHTNMIDKCQLLLSTFPYFLWVFFFSLFYLLFRLKNFLKTHLSKDISN